MNWKKAKRYCGNLSLSGYSDWRLPDKDTLEKMFAWSQGGHYSEDDLRKMFPDIPLKVQSPAYWSSTTNGLNTYYAFHVGFNSGLVYYSNKNHSNYVRCVRG